MEYMWFCCFGLVIQATNNFYIDKRVKFEAYSSCKADCLYHNRINISNLFQQKLEFLCDLRSKATLTCLTIVIKCFGKLLDAFNVQFYCKIILGM
jgi:hypothetical protein